MAPMKWVLNQSLACFVTVYELRVLMALYEMRSSSTTNQNLVWWCCPWAEWAPPRCTWLRKNDWSIGRLLHRKWASSPSKRLCTRWVPLLEMTCFIIIIDWFMSSNNMNLPPIDSLFHKRSWALRAHGSQQDECSNKMSSLSIVSLLHHGLQASRAHGSVGQQRRRPFFTNNHELASSSSSLRFMSSIHMALWL